MWTEDEVLSETESLRKRADDAEEELETTQEELSELRRNLEDNYISAMDVLVSLVRSGLARHPARSLGNLMIPPGYLKLWLEEQLADIEYRGGRKLP